MRVRRIHLTAAIAALALCALPAATFATKPDGPPGLSKERTPEIEVTLDGTIESSPDDRGRALYQLTDGGTTYELSAGPRWYWRDNNPLAAYVGQDVTVTGTSHDGSTEVEVRTVNGSEIRGKGRPRWAGGWKTVGAQHPGWSEEKSARFGLKFGACFPPGHCKERSHQTDDAAEDAPAGGEAPGG
jgi:hypothetical protein